MFNSTSSPSLTTSTSQTLSTSSDEALPPRTRVSFSDEDETVHYDIDSSASPSKQNRSLPIIGATSRYSFSSTEETTNLLEEESQQDKISKPPPPTSTTTSTTSTLKFLVYIFLYISTGILQPLIIDTLRINSALGRPILLLPTLANTSGMALCGIFATKSQWKAFFTLYSPQLLKQILSTAVIDLLSGMALTFGLWYTGGSIFVILYNSCPAWTAILSFLILKKRLNMVQFGGVLLVCGGLIVNVLGANWDLRGQEERVVTLREGEESEKDSLENVEIAGVENKVVMGSLVVLLGSILHSLMFVLSERSMKNNDNDKNNNNASAEKENKKNSDDADKKNNMAVSPPIWSCCLGTLEASFMIAWVVLHIVTGGFYDEEFHPYSSSPSSNTSNNNAMMAFQNSPVTNGFLILLLIDTIHAASFFALLRDLGSIVSALLKGIQMITVVFISSIFFCSSEQSSSSTTQCLTWWKIYSVLLVLTGTFLYAVTSSKSYNNRRIMKLKRKKKLFCGNYNQDVGRKIRMCGGCGDVDEEGTMIPMMDLETATTVVGRRPKAASGGAAGGGAAKLPLSEVMESHNMHRSGGAGGSGGGGSAKLSLSDVMESHNMRRASGMTTNKNNF